MSARNISTPSPAPRRAGALPPGARRGWSRSAMSSGPGPRWMAEPMTDYDPFMATVVEGDPNPLYAELRAKTPRLFIERYNAWFFSTFEDVWTLEKERRLSVEGGITPSQLLLGAPANRLMVSQMEPPVHTPFRTAFNELVKPSIAQKMEAAMREEARALLAPILAQGGGDLLLGYAGPLAAKFGCWI